MKLRIILIVGLLALLSASCSPFDPGVPSGVIKTANGGADWQFANKVTEPAAGTLGGLSISKLVIDPTRTDRVFVSTYDDGVFVSEDTGNSWKRILSRFTVYDFVIHPASADIIYAAGIFDERVRVLATRDGGKSWVEVFNEATTNNPVRSIALNPANPNEIVIGLASGAVIKSEDSGNNWRLLQNYGDRINRIRWQESLYVLTRTKGLYQSSDGGASFRNITNSILPSNNFLSHASGLLISPAGVANFNQVAISTLSPSTIYLTTSSGLYRTFNGGDSWSFVPLPSQQQQLEAMALALAPSTDNVIYTSLGSTIYKTSDGGNSWQAQDTQTNGLINTITVHPELPQQAYAGIYAQ